VDKTGFLPPVVVYRIYVYIKCAYEHKYRHHLFIDRVMCVCASFSFSSSLLCVWSGLKKLVFHQGTKR
jgi:hypothetical protein